MAAFWRWEVDTLVTTYAAALTEAMTALGKRKDTVFLGQAVRYRGTAMHQTFEGVPDDKKIEMPVAENMQMGIATGLALGGSLPITVYPRINFLLLAIDQLVLHLDKISLYSGYLPRVIIRTAIATDKPLDPGAQHVGDYSDAIEAMLSTVKVVRLREAARIVPEYLAAAERDVSTLLVEYASLYND